MRLFIYRIIYRIEYL